MNLYFPSFELEAFIYFNTQKELKPIILTALIRCLPKKKKEKLFELSAFKTTIRTTTIRTTTIRTTTASKSLGRAVKANKSRVRGPRFNSCKSR